VLHPEPEFPFGPAHCAGHRPLQRWRSFSMLAAPVRGVPCGTAGTSQTTLAGEAGPRDKGQDRRLIPESPMTGMSLRAQAKERTLFAPFISVIVPVRNEGLLFHATLNQLLDQDYPARRYEVIVVDGESTDGTASLVRRLQAEHPHLRLLSNPKRWS